VGATEQRRYRRNYRQMHAKLYAIEPSAFAYLFLGVTHKNSRWNIVSMRYTSIRYTCVIQTANENTRESFLESAV